MENNYQKSTIAAFMDRVVNEYVSGSDPRKASDLVAEFNNSNNDYEIVVFWNGTHPGENFVQEEGSEKRTTYQIRDKTNNTITPEINYTPISSPSE